MAASILINTFAAEFSKFGNFMFAHVRKTMAADPDAEMPDVDEMVRLYLQPQDATDIKIKKPRAKPTITAEVSQVSIETGATGASKVSKASKASKGGKTKELCTAITGKGTQCTRCATKDQVFCLVHLKVSQAKAGGDKNKKTKAAPKKKKADDMPKHTHPIEEIPEAGSCDLCSTHGNPLNEDDAESQFEVKGVADETLPFELEEDVDVASVSGSMILGEEEFDED